MSNRRRLANIVRAKLRSAGRQYAEARRAYDEGMANRGFDLPTDGNGDARIVCRRHAEKRTVSVDIEGRPACFDPGHSDCEGCAEDIREGVIEIW